jgi:hypothetical protein
MGTKFERKDKQKRVAFDKKKLSSANKNKIELRSEEVEVPELNVLMDFKEDEVAIIIVRQMKLDELIEIQHNQFDMMRNLVEGVIEAAIDKNAVRNEIADALGNKNSAFTQRIDTIEKCIVEPKLSRSEILYIAKMFPSVVVKLYTVIINLTDKGADLKKNSIE